MHVHVCASVCVAVTLSPATQAPPAMHDPLPHMLPSSYMPPRHAQPPSCHPLPLHYTCPLFAMHLRPLSHVSPLAMHILLHQACPLPGAPPVVCAIPYLLHMPPYTTHSPCEQNDWQTGVKYYCFRNYSKEWLPDSILLLRLCEIVHFEEEMTQFFSDDYYDYYESEEIYFIYFSFLFIAEKS